MLLVHIKRKKNIFYPVAGKGVSFSSGFPLVVLKAYLSWALDDGDLLEVLPGLLPDLEAAGLHGLVAVLEYSETQLILLVVQPPPLHPSSSTHSTFKENS